jgi:hypothetical protein
MEALVPVSAAARAALGAALVVFLIGGCSGEKQERTVASAGGTPAATAADGEAVTAYVEGVRRYVACLRDEGVAVSDPDAKGRYEFSGDRRALKTDPKFRAAVMKCKDLNPPMPAGLEDKPALTPEEIEVARRYARCMQANGAPDFPDPGPDGHAPDSNGTPPWDPTSPGGKRATAACAAIIGEPAAPTGAAG